MQNALNPILIADDDVALAGTLADFLRNRGMDCICARTGKQALAQFELHHPKLVLLDIRMPGLDGVGTAWHIHKTAPDVPIILMSGCPNALEEAGDGTLAFAAVIGKPISLKALGRLIDRFDREDPIGNGLTGNRKAG